MSHTYTPPPETEFWAVVLMVAVVLAVLLGTACNTLHTHPARPRCHQPLNTPGL